MSTFSSFFPGTARQTAIALAIGAAWMSCAADDEPSDSNADEVHRTYLETLRRENLYPSAISCSQCHPDHFKEWSVSPHAYASLSPVFNSMHSFIVDRTSGTVGDFCIRCHTAPGMDREENIYGSVLLRSPIATEGVTCISCHRINGDYGTASGRMPMEKGPLQDPIYGPSGNKILKEALADPDLMLVTSEEERGKLVHRDAIQTPVFARPAQCAACHDVNSPSGLRLESAFTEFKNSPAAKEGTTCQDCHMSKTQGAVLPIDERFKGDRIDRNYHYEPVAHVRSSPTSPGEGMPTKARKRTSHMFVGPDYSIVHPGIFPHNLDAAELTYGARFRKTLSDEQLDLVEYLKNLPEGENTEKIRKSAEREDLQLAASKAKMAAVKDWLDYRWWEGWGTDWFEDNLSEEEKNSRLAGVEFPWADPDDPISATMRRKTARYILSEQFNLLNEAHVERTRILRRALQLGDFAVTRDDHGGLQFRINIHNATAGHAVPTGFDAERVMYLEVTVTDNKGRTLFQSGDRDPNGDLRDLHSAYVHAEEPKSGKWLEETAWKDHLGLKRKKDDLCWQPDEYLFSLQSKFVGRNLSGGETEHILAVNTSIDPLPFLRPPTSAQVHTGRGGGIRKQFRTIPPLSHKTATYKIGGDQLSGARPYRIQFRFLSQMVPVNLIKKISPVGFDMKLSAREVADRVAYGHQVDSRGTRKGGAVILWDECVTLKEPSAGLALDFTPGESEILSVPVSDYPFPHTPAEEIAARKKALSGSREIEDFMIQHLGPLLPEMWPGGIPEGISLFPEDPVKVEKPEGGETAQN